MDQDRLIALRVAARFTALAKDTKIPRIEHILTAVPSLIDTIYDLARIPVENGKKLPKTKLNAKIDAWTAEIHGMLVEYEGLEKDAYHEVAALPEKERKEAQRLLSSIAHRVPKSSMAKMIVKEGKAAKLREELLRVTDVWRRIGALLNGQQMLFTATRRS